MIKAWNGASEIPAWEDLGETGLLTLRGREVAVPECAWMCSFLRET
jgi:hypothetical protein